MNKDLRTFIGEARQLGPAYFATVSRPVDPIFEPCILQQKLAADGRYPVIRCDRMNGSDLPLATNLFGSYELLGLALGVDPDEPKSAILRRFMEREQNPMPTETIAAADSPVKQKIFTGDDIDLGALPIVQHAEKDSGKYITVGVMVVRDPDTGVINAGMYRHEVQGRDKLGCMFNPAHHAGYIYRRYKELNKRMEVVIFLGHPIYAVSVVLTSLLCSAGVGSLVAGRIGTLTQRHLRLIEWAIVSLIIGVCLLMNFVMPSLLDFSLAGRITVVSIIIAPLGVALGMPFPTGMRIVQAQCPELLPWCWAINGFLSVFSSVFCIVISMAVGFSVVLLASAAVYAVGFLALRQQVPAEPASS